MLKTLILIAITFIVACHAQNEQTQDVARRNPFKHHHGLYHGLKHYWIFLAVKAKIVFLIATFISFWVFAGKGFAFLYYISRKESCKCPQYHEKLVLPEEPHFEHKYSTLNVGPPIDYPNGNGYDGPPMQFSPYERYSARSMENSIFSKKGLVNSLITSTDLTEMTFDAMKLKKNSCKRRFVCEIEQRTKKNNFLTLGMYMFSDIGLTKYRTNTTINSVDDCYTLGPECN